MFRNKISKWLDYDGLTYTFYQDNKFLAVTDVSNFFENVSSSQVVDSLTELAAKCDCSGYEKGHIRSAINVLSLLLQNWSYSGDFGLPQNRDASSFLSNVLLCRVDFEMQAQNYDYYRYVDDIRIICKTELIAQRALQNVTSLLRDVGMNINAGKTTILSKKSSVSEIYEHFPSRDPLVAAIDSMWRSRSRRVFMRSIEYIVEIIQESFDKGETQSRSFRFAVNRLSQLADAGLFDVSGVFAEKLLDYAIQVLKSEARSTDQICRLITVLEPDNVYLGKLGDYLVDRENCLHDWQNHLLWMLLASHQFDREDLRDFAESFIANDPTSGEASGVFIWLQAIGHLSPIESLVDKYTSLWPFQNQRYFLIALSGCSASSRDKLRGKVPFNLRGTIDRSRKKFRDDGVAIRYREKPSLSDLYEDIKDYC